MGFNKSFNIQQYNVAINLIYHEKWLKIKQTDAHFSSSIKDKYVQVNCLCSYN